MSPTMACPAISVSSECLDDCSYRYAWLKMSILIRMLLSSAELSPSVGAQYRVMVHL